ncbi:MAG: tyrosine-type recombinase/integrase [Niameybacter sp.]
MNELMNYFEEYLGYLSAEKNVSKYTIDNYSSDFKIFTHFLLLKELPLDMSQIKTRDLRSYLIYLKNVKKYQNESIRRKVNALRSFFAFLTDQEYINKNPAHTIHTPKREEKLPIYMSEFELELFLKTIDATGKKNAQHDLCMFKTLAYTGIRRQECINLNWNDINFGTNTITINLGKCKKSRVVPMPPSLAEILWEYLQTRLPLSSQAVFLSEAENRISASIVETRFRKYIKKAGLTGKGFTVHKLRHTYASHLVLSGVGLLSVQQLLGHSDLNSTKVYTHINTSHLKKEIEKSPFK